MKEVGSASLDLVRLVGFVLPVHEPHGLAPANHIAAVRGLRCVLRLGTSAAAVAVARSLDHRAGERLHLAPTVGVVDHEVQHFLHRLSFQ